MTIGVKESCDEEEGKDEFFGSWTLLEYSLCIAHSDVGLDDIGIAERGVGEEPGPETLSC